MVVVVVVADGGGGGGGATRGRGNFNGLAAAAARGCHAHTGEECWPLSPKESRLTKDQSQRLGPFSRCTIAAKRERGAKRDHLLHLSSFGRSLAAHELKGRPLAQAGACSSLVREHFKSCKREEREKRALPELRQAASLETPPALLQQVFLSPLVRCAFALSGAGAATKQWRWI